jgi:hypothetical protein
MFRKVAIALIAASMLTAPVMAKAPAATTPAGAPTSSAAVKTVKADKSALKHRKHVRAHHATRVSKHKHMNAAKHARHHFNGGKGHKTAGANKVVFVKPATRSGTN